MASVKSCFASTFVVLAIARAQDCPASCTNAYAAWRRTLFNYSSGVCEGTSSTCPSTCFDLFNPLEACIGETTQACDVGDSSFSEVTKASIVSPQDVQGLQGLERRPVVHGQCIPDVVHWALTPEGSPATLCSYDLCSQAFTLWDSTLGVTWCSPEVATGSACPSQCLEIMEAMFTRCDEDSRNMKPKGARFNDNKIKHLIENRRLISLSDDNNKCKAVFDQCSWGEGCGQSFSYDLPGDPKG